MVKSAQKLPKTPKSAPKIGKKPGRRAINPRADLFDSAAEALGFTPSSEAGRGYADTIAFMFGEEKMNAAFGSSLALDYPPALLPQAQGEKRVGTVGQAALWDAGFSSGLNGRLQPGWIPATSLSGGGYDLPEATRRRILQLARGMAIYNPLVSHAVGLFTTFSVGEGVKFNVGEPTKPPKDSTESVSTKQAKANSTSTSAPVSRAKTVLDNFVANPRNRGVMSGIGQQQVVSKFVQDGETFIGTLMKEGNGGNCEIRTFDPLEFVAIYYNPDDAAQPWVYHRQFTTLDGKQKNLFYRDWTDEKTGGTFNINDLGLQVGGTIGMVPDKNGNVRYEDMKIYHVNWGTGRRGVSMLSAALPWAQAHKKFMEARVSIEQSLARFAWSAKTQGGPDGVQAEKARWQSTAATGRETNPVNAPGSILFQNKGVDYKPFPQDTGAESAKVDGGMLIQMFAIALGLFPHYMGSGEAFRLATATAMEPPMRKLFLRFQTIWDQVYTDIVGMLFKATGVPKKDTYIRVDFPELWNVDVPALVEAMARLMQSLPAVAEIDEVMKILLMHIGVSDPQGLWNQIAPALRGRIRKMNDARVIGPNGGVTPASAGDDKRTPRPGGKKANGGSAKTKPKKAQGNS